MFHSLQKYRATLSLTLRFRCNINSTLLTDSFQAFNTTSGRHVQVSQFEKNNHYNHRWWNQIRIYNSDYYKYSYHYHPVLIIKRNIIKHVQLYTPERVINITNSINFTCTTSINVEGSCSSMIPMSFEKRFRILPDLNRFAIRTRNRKTNTVCICIT